MPPLAAARPCTVVLVPGCRGFWQPGDYLPPRVSAVLLRADARSAPPGARHAAITLRVPVLPGRGTPLPPMSWRCLQHDARLLGPAAARLPCVAHHPVPTVAGNAGLRPQVPDAPEPPEPGGRNARPRHRPGVPCADPQLAAHT